MSNGSKNAYYRSNLKSHYKRHTRVCIMSRSKFTKRILQLPTNYIWSNSSQAIKANSHQKFNFLIKDFYISASHSSICCCFPFISLYFFSISHFVRFRFATIAGYQANPWTCSILSYNKIKCIETKLPSGTTFNSQHSILFFSSAPSVWGSSMGWVGARRVVGTAPCFLGWIWLI